MFWFEEKPNPEYEALRAKQSACKHEGRFEVLGSNSARPPCGTCKDCGAEVPLDQILNTYLKKMDAILDMAGVR